MDPVTITSQFHLNGFAPNICETATTYEGQSLTATGATWAESRANLLNRCNQIKALGPIPVSETVDLDAPSS